MVSPIDDRRGDDGPLDRFLASHERTIDEFNRAYAKLTDDVIPRITRLAVITHPVLIPWREEITERVTQTVRFLADLDRQLKLLLLSWALPLRLWDTASQWVEVRESVSSVAGDLAATNREVHVRWQGVAADAYHAFVPAHSAAASRLATVADTVPFALNQAASTIAQLYAAVLGLLVGFIGAAMIALATASTVVGAPVAVVLLLVLAGTLLVTVTSVLTSTAQTLGAMEVWLTRMRSDVQDNTAFPGGRWPAARSELLTDATTTDGDPSDWTVRP